MPAFTGKTFSSFYKNLLGINQASNIGVTTSTKEIQDGTGDNTSISLSDDQLIVKPQNDNTVSTFVAQDNGANNILAVDTTNSRVLCGSSQVNALTMYQEFNATAISTAAGHHYMLATATAGYITTYNLEEISLGNGADPALVLDVSAESDDTYLIVPHYWYLPDAITIMSAHVLSGAYAATDRDLNFHLVSYDMSTSAGTYGDLSGGVIVADSGLTEEVTEDVIKIDTMTNLPTDVAAGKVILATVESNATDLISVKIIVKYHIQ